MQGPKPQDKMLGTSLDVLPKIARKLVDKGLEGCLRSQNSACCTLRCPSRDCEQRDERATVWLALALYPTMVR